MPWRQLAWPVPWEARFGRRAPLRVEIASGNGEFLEASAAREPEANWIGVDISWISVKNLMRRIQARNLDHVQVVQGDGRLVLDRLFPPGSVEAIFVNHSDPWPKKRHHARRLVQPSFLAAAARALEPGGRLVLVTDHPEYAAWIEDALRGQEALAPPGGEPWVESLPGYVETKYQRRGRVAGSTIRYFVWVKVAEPPEPAAGPPPQEEIGMPNVLLDGEVDFPALLNGFSERSWRLAYRDLPVFVQLAAAYLKTDGREWLVEARVKEGGFDQHLVLSVHRHGERQILVKPSPVGYPRPTWGVRAAVRLLGELLLLTHPGLSVHSTNVAGTE